MVELKAGDFLRKEIITKPLFSDDETDNDKTTINVYYWETIYKKIPDKSPEAATKYSGIGYFDVEYGYVLRWDNKECFIKASEYYSSGNGVWLKYPDSHFNYIEEEIDNT